MTPMKNYRMVLNGRLYPKRDKLNVQISQVKKYCETLLRVNMNQIFSFILHNQSLKQPIVAFPAGNRNVCIEDAKKPF